MEHFKTPALFGNRFWIPGNFGTPDPSIPTLALGPAANTTVTPVVGATVLTGAAPVTVRGTVIRPAVGALALTGLAPAVSTPQPHLIQPAVGALALTGAAPSLRMPLLIKPAVGALALTGASPALLTPQLLRPTVGALTVTGVQPLVTRLSYIALKPVADLARGNWTASSGPTDPLYPMIDEDIPDEADYIISGFASATPDDAQVQLTPIADPGSNQGYSISYGLKGVEDPNGTVYLYAGATLIKQWDHVAVGPTEEIFERTLTSGEVDAFRAAGGYADPRLTFSAYT